MLRRCALGALLAVLVLSCAASSEDATDARSNDLHPPANRSTSFACSIERGFNFNKNAHQIVGFVNSLKIGEKELAADIDVTNPEKVSGDPIMVFGVLSGIYWEGGYADPIQFSAQVKTDNKNELTTLVHRTLANTEVEIEFTVYEHDAMAKRYYKAFHCNGRTLKGLVHKSGGELSMSIDSDEGMEVVSPKNFAFTLGVMPADLAGAQMIYRAISSVDQFEEAWGAPIAP